MTLREALRIAVIGFGFGFAVGGHYNTKKWDGLVQECLEMYKRDTQALQDVIEQDRKLGQTQCTPNPYTPKGI